MINPYNLTTIYVSQQFGCDKETGFSKTIGKLRNGPLKTIEKALERVAEMRSFGYLQPISIKILDEEYVLDKPVIIKNNVFNITIEPYSKTLISGGVKVQNFKKDTFNNTECFSAYIPEITEKGLWFTDFYVDSEHAQFTRYPKEGTLLPESVENNDGDLHAHSKWFIAKKEDLAKIKSFKNFNDCFISYNHYWIDEHTPIESYDVETGKIVCQYYSRFSLSSDKPESALRYIIENVAESFSNPNEWYLDRETSKVYYVPRNSSQTPENITAYFPVSEKLFIIEGTPEKSAENICIRGFEFAYTTGDYKSTAQLSRVFIPEDGSEPVFASDPQSVASAHGAVELEFASHCQIDGCSFHNLGVHAIKLKEGSKSISVINNDIWGMGGGGISVLGSPEKGNVAAHTCNIVISNNIIRNLGKRYFAACGILVRHAYDNTISHNEISDLYYTGISVGWVWGYANNISKNNIIEYNHIYNLGQGKLSDMGGIYLLGKQQGTIVRNNLIHDILSAHYGGWGIYTDEGSSYILVENNICYNLSCNCYHQHYGCMNTARNNIFVASKEEPVKLSRDEMHVGMIFEGNIIVSDGTPIFRTGYDDEDSGSVHTIVSDGNIIFDLKNDEPIFITIGEEKFSLDEAQKILGIDNNTIVADPGFANFAERDFTLSTDSPVLRLGFKPIDTKYIGILR